MIAAVAVLCIVINAGARPVTGTAYRAIGSAGEVTEDAGSSAIADVCGRTHRSRRVAAHSGSAIRDRQSTSPGAITEHAGGTGSRGVLVATDTGAGAIADIGE